MLNIRKLTKSVGGRTLFEDASFTVNYSERVALVGPNGAGKSTLFNIILGLDHADKGDVDRDEWTTLGFLPQEAESLGEETIRCAIPRSTSSSTRTTSTWRSSPRLSSWTSRSRGRSPSPAGPSMARHETRL